MKLTDEQRREIVELWDYGNGILAPSLAVRFGVSKSTIYRVINPDLAERTRQQSLEAKRRRHGVCVDCGGKTKYNGHNGAVSARCAACQTAKQMASRVWTAEAVIEAIQRFARLNGRPPTAVDWSYAKRGPYPPTGACYRTRNKPNAPFASWADAIEAAGFRRPRVGQYQRRSPIEQAQLIAGQARAA